MSNLTEGYDQNSEGDAAEDRDIATIHYNFSADILTTCARSLGVKPGVESADAAGGRRPS